MDKTSLLKRLDALFDEIALSKLSGTIIIVHDRGTVVSITKAETEKFTAEDGAKNGERR